MARSRTEFQAKLRTIAPKAWYIRPSNNSMQYPCFVYKHVRPVVVRADNIGYNRTSGYEVIYISETENEGIIETMLTTFEHCSPGAPYISDDLFHYPFTIYF